jgi:hypothetical protein
LKCHPFFKYAVPFIPFKCTIPVQNMPSAFKPCCLCILCVCLGVVVWGRVWAVSSTGQLQHSSRHYARPVSGIHAYNIVSIYMCVCICIYIHIKYNIINWNHIQITDTIECVPSLIPVSASPFSPCSPYISLQPFSFPLSLFVLLSGWAAVVVCGHAASAPLDPRGLASPHAGSKTRTHHRTRTPTQVSMHKLIDATYFYLSKLIVVYRRWLCHSALLVWRDFLCAIHTPMYANSVCFILCSLVLCVSVRVYVYCAGLVRCLFYLVCVCDVSKKLHVLW